MNNMKAYFSMFQSRRQSFDHGHFRLDGYKYPEAFYISPFYANGWLVVFHMVLSILFVNLSVDHGWVTMMGAIGVGVSGGLLIGLNWLPIPLRNQPIYITFIDRWATNMAEFLSAAFLGK